jgi:hypothetical protein
MVYVAASGPTSTSPSESLAVSSVSPVPMLARTYAYGHITAFVTWAVEVTPPP